jgi:molecular chaperone GrpE
MPDATPSPVSEGVVRPAPQVLTRDQIDAVLADFRSWLEQLADTPSAITDTSAAASPPDLHTLLAQFTALRHEINLQTRSSRTQQEQAAEALRQLNTALDTSQRKEEETAEKQNARDEEMLRPLLKTLVDIYDALALARREILRVRETVLPELEQMKEWPRLLAEKAQEQPSPGAPEPVAPVPSFWSRLVGKKTAVPPESLVAAERQWREQLGRDQQDTAERLAQASGRVGPMLAALVAGYTMSMQRVERALQQYELEPIPAAGQAFDPERMEAVEVTIEPGRTVTEVIDEVRRGYLWHGRVFRFAQVRVARPELG